MIDRRNTCVYVFNAVHCKPYQKQPPPQAIPTQGGVTPSATFHHRTTPHTAHRPDNYTPAVLNPVLYILL